MTIPSITPLTTPTPSTADPDNFDTRADILFTELPIMVTQFNTSIASVDTVADEINADKVAAELAETNAETAQAAAELAETNAETAETGAMAAQTASETIESFVSTFGQNYLGAKSTPPTLDNEGHALIIGAMYFDTPLNIMKVYSDSGWVNAGSSVNGTSNRASFVVGTPSGSYDGSTTVFPIVYDAGFVDVYLNGVKLTPSDFTATNGTSITLAVAGTVGYSMDLIAYGTFEVTNAVLSTTTDVSTSAWTLDEDDMASDSAAKVPTQQSTKAYVDAATAGDVVLASVEAESGRNIATDGTKLDGIETAATADQTDAEILTAVESESGRDIADDGTSLDDLQQYLQDQIANGPGYWFDGVDDYIPCGNANTLDPGTGDFSLVLGCTLGENPKYLLSKKYEGTEREGGYIIRAVSKLYQFRIANGINYVTSQNDGGELIPGTNYILAATFVRSGNGVRYVNGKQHGSADDISSLAGTVIASPYMLYINARNAGGINNWSDGQTFLVRIFNLALDPTDPVDKAIINGGAVPYKYQGASQTNKLINGNFSSASHWSVGNGASIEAGYVSFSATNHFLFTIGYNVGGVFGNKYRISINVITNTIVGDATLKSGGVNAAEITGVCGVVFSDLSVGVHSEEFVCVGTGGNSMFAFMPEGTLTSGVLEITDIVLTHLGCVADYLPSGVGHNSWIDNSGNGNHGQVSGAMPTNIPANHTEFYSNTITADDSFTLPAGYLIDAITLTSTGSIGGGIDIGTTNGGGEIVTAQAVTGTTPVNCTLVGGSHYNTTGADDTIYITDADGTGWDARSVKIQVSMKRMEVL